MIYYTRRDSIRGLRCLRALVRAVRAALSGEFAHRSDSPLTRRVRRELGHSHYGRAVNRITHLLTR